MLQLKSLLTIIIIWIIREESVNTIENYEIKNIIRLKVSNCQYNTTDFIEVIIIRVYEYVNI